MAKTHSLAVTRPCPSFVRFHYCQLADIDVLVIASLCL